MDDAFKIAPIFVASLSLLISLYVALRNWRYSETAVRYTSRNQYMNALFDIDRQLIARPELWAIYDHNALAQAKSMEPAEIARRQAFIFYHLNLFETVFSDYVKVLRLTPTDREYWDSWQRYMYDFFATSSEARAVFERGIAYEFYMSDFSRFVKSIIAHIEEQQGGSPASEANVSMAARLWASRERKMPPVVLGPPTLRERMIRAFKIIRDRVPTRSRIPAPSGSSEAKKS